MQEFRRSDESEFLDSIIKSATEDWIENEVNPEENWTDTENNIVTDDSKPSQEQEMEEQRDLDELESYSTLFNN